jgi:hypothetical protein
MEEQEKAFDPTPHILNLKGKAYLPVAARVVWFRQEFGIETGWEIRTACVEGSFKEGYAVYRAEVVNPEGRVVATGTNAEDKGGFVDFVMKAETGAIGRALATCGYGTMAALDEGEVVDAPIQRGINAQATGGRAGAADAPARTQGERGRSNVAVRQAESAGDRAAAAASAAGADVGPVAPVSLFCDQCGVEVEEKVAAVSQRRWDRTVCVTHGRELAALEKANVPAGQIA